MGEPRVAGERCWESRLGRGGWEGQGRGQGRWGESRLGAREVG